MTGWERLGTGGLSQGYLSGRLSPSARLPAAPGAGEGKPTLANRKSRIMRRRVATHNVRDNGPPSHYFGYLRIRSLVLPSNEHAIQRDPNEVIIGV
jgi:hypothetical protein